MVVAVEPKMVFPGVGAVGLENDYLVIETGVKRLSVTDDAMVYLPEIR
jgi:Xaa-Pro aminopeptidase